MFDNTKEVLGKTRKIIKTTLGTTLHVLSSDELDAIKIALATTAIQAGSNGNLTTEQATVIATQVVGLVDGIGNKTADIIEQ